MNGSHLVRFYSRPKKSVMAKIGGVLVNKTIIFSENLFFLNFMAVLRSLVEEFEIVHAIFEKSVPVSVFIHFGDFRR